MNSRDFQDYAELWREQIGREELADLEVSAKAIARNADRRRWRDIALGLLPVGMTGIFLSSNSTSLQIKLAFVPLLAVAIGFAWRRHQIARAARAIEANHPHHFFQAAICNLRSELKLSSFAVWAGWPVFILTVALVKTAQGIDIIGWFRSVPRDLNLFGIAVLAGFALSYLFFLREHFRLRAQLRRLEAMCQEWDDEAPR